MLPNVSSCNKLISRKNLFVKKNSFVVMSVFHVGHLSVASSEAFIQRCSSIKYGASTGRYSFGIAVVNIFRKFLEKYQQQSSYSVLLTAFNIRCCGWFSENFLKIFRTAFSKNTAGGTLLILYVCSLKISRTPFHPLMPGGNKRSYLYKQTSN